jgi:hypothetical protein
MMERQPVDKGTLINGHGTLKITTVTEGDGIFLYKTGSVEELFYKISNSMRKLILFTGFTLLK